MPYHLHPKSLIVIIKKDNNYIETNEESYS